MIIDKNGKMIFAFVKYSELEYLKSFQKGEMFCNTVNNFAKIDEKNGIGDKLENIYKITKGKGAIFDLTKERHNATVTMNKQQDGDFLCYYKNDGFFANYFCLYSVFGSQELENQTKKLINGEMKDYNHLLLILKPKEFLNRVRVGLEKANVFKPQMAFITYSKIGEVTGIKTYYEKPERYTYQNEFRIGFLNNEEKTERVDIGDLSDITRIFSKEEVQKVSFEKNDENLIVRLEEISERHIKELELKNSTYQFLKKEAIFKYDSESIIQFKKAKLEVTASQKSYYEFLSNIVFE
jgi:hypothetical protein